jgi:hypothetical protein
MAKVNDIRIVRADPFNYAVEKLHPVGDAPSGKESLNKGKLVWKTMGFYGENLRAAVIGAIRHGFDPKEGQSIVEELKRVESVVLSAVNEIKLNPGLLAEAVVENQIEGEEVKKKAGRGRKKKGA